jgi:lactam utilization protein B
MTPASSRSDNGRRQFASRASEEGGTGGAVMRTVLIAGVVASCFLVGCASQEPAAKKAGRHSRATLQERFDEKDTNKDGKLSWKELAAGLSGREEERARKMFDEADANGDGLVTREEAQKAVRSL